MKYTPDSLQEKLDSLWLEPVIWLETHVTVTNTESKLFCACENQEWAAQNTCICPICTGQMGVLPLLNKEVVKEAVKLGLAIESDIAKIISFDRKHYYYPDLPKGFQITQYENPVAIGGKIDCYRKNWETFSVHLDHFHIEEDPAKLTHTKTGTLIDYNRSGKPLLEIVTQPDIHSIDDALSYMDSLHKLVRALNISDADMEKGQFKSDISISLRKKWENILNPRTEIKNMNSFKFSQEAIVQEISQQLSHRSTTWGPKQEQLTVKWNEQDQKIEVMRKKENVNDYRIMPEPDIPFVSLEWIEREVFINRDMLPFEIEKRLLESANITIKEAQFFSNDIPKAALLFEVNKELNDLDFLVKIFMNLFSEEHYSTFDAQKLIPLFRAYKDQNMFTHWMLKTCIQRLSSDLSFNWERYVESESISEDLLDQAIDTVCEDTANTEVILEIKKWNDKAVSKLVGWVIKSLGKQVPWDIVKDKIYHKIWVSTASLYQKSESSQGKTPSQSKEKFSLDDFYIANNYRSHKLKEIDESFLDNKVSLWWWIQGMRDHWDLVFIDLREDGEIFQIKISKDVFGDLKKIDSLTNESVILCEWIIKKRGADDINPHLRTGTIELDTTQLHVLSKAGPLPFEVKKSHQVNEAKRMQYRYLDLRNNKVRDNVYMRHHVIKEMRNFLDEQDFIEVETPIIGKASDEWSREFIVPSRMHPWQFYVLPQSPQQLKQLLIGSWIDKYYQLARCFRDEDPKWDRQPEFTQLDIELAFTNQEEIIKLVSDMLLQITETHYPDMKIQNEVIPRFDYAEVMENYGTDKPDLRYGLKMTTITDLLQDTQFDIFKKPIAAGGIVKCIRVGKEDADFTKKYLDEKLKNFSIQQGLWWLANFHVGDPNFISEKLWDTVVDAIIDRTGSSDWDTLLFAAWDEYLVNKALDSVRQKIAKDFKLYDDNELAFCRVENFPMFEKTDEGRWKFTHNPFSMPNIEDLKKYMHCENEDDIASIVAQQYDIVLNGNEIWWWSMRAHIPEILESTYKIMGYSAEEIEKSVGHMLKAFSYWFPPHGGIALGVDRLLMILQKHSTIREVIAFPKTWEGKDLMMNSPSPISIEKMHESNIDLLK